MYAPHFAAALAVKSKAKSAPLWALMVGAFLADLLWILFARIGIEPAQQDVFFDDWSHSLFAIVFEASVFAAFFFRRGRTAVIAIWLAVFSHFLLDVPVHPKRLALYPLSKIHLGWESAPWGNEIWLGAPKDWWLQFFVLLTLLLVYMQGSHANHLPGRLVLASCLLLLSVQLLTLYPCFGY
jgi:uncharacterized integral membrane protein